MKMGASYAGFNKFKQSLWFNADRSFAYQSVSQSVCLLHLWCASQHMSGALGEGGQVKEAHSEFLVLMEDMKRQPDLAKRVQRCQLCALGHG